MAGPRVAIIFDNFGPYHWARLEAAAQICELTAIEVFDRAEHAWIRKEKNVAFATRTVARNATERHISLETLSFALQDALREARPEVVLIPGWSCAASFVAQLWCAANSIPVVVMSESNSWDETRFGWKEWVKSRLVRTYSAALVGGTPHVEYMMELGMSGDHVFQGYDAVDNSFFAQRSGESRHAAFRNRLGLPERYFLASARFVEKKNLARLIQAFARYKQKLEASTQQPALRSQQSRPWSLVLLGDGPLKADLYQLIADLGLKGAVMLPGFKQYEELPAYYGLATAFVHASTTEQWGLVVNEAMASGLPVLVSNRCGCARDLVKEGVNGFTFDPYNIEEIAELMLNFTIVTPQLSALGDASQQIISYWGTERFRQGVHASIQKAIETGPRRMVFGDRMMLKMLALRK